MTPLERAARAMAKIDSPDPSALVGSPPQPIWHLYVPRVRAVIAAIREPSEAMREAAYGLEVEIRTTMGNLERGHSDGDGLFQAMIDALLEEGQ